MIGAQLCLRIKGGSAERKKSPDWVTVTSPRGNRRSSQLVFLLCSMWVAAVPCTDTLQNHELARVPRETPHSRYKQGCTHRNEFEHLINDDDWETKIQYCLPLSPVQGNDMEECLGNNSDINQLHNPRSFSAPVSIEFVCSRRRSNVRTDDSPKGKAHRES